MNKEIAENKLLELLQEDGIVDIFEFDDLARTYLGHFVVEDMSQDDVVGLIADRFGMELTVRDDIVFLVDYV